LAVELGFAPKMQDKMIDAMVRLEKALKPHIARLKV
jgi:hypothetical protein